ncbi:MAG: hypothetical protein H0X40_04005 [Chthoniobacterales bacterium]|nr:hypothetical protein [Chthoniobacterales bacterium]
MKQIKASADYNESIGQAFGIEGTPQVGPDYATLAPVLGLSSSGGQVSIAWGWQGFSAFLDQCELQVDRGDGKGMVLLAIDTTQARPTPRPSRMRPRSGSTRLYRVGDNRVGQWSNQVSIAVGV